MKTKTRKRAKRTNVNGGSRCVQRVVRPSLHPQHLRTTDDVWFYEDKRGLEFYIGTGMQTGYFRVPWEKILHSMSRCRPNGRTEAPRE